MKQIIYEDALAKVTFADNPVALGHLRIFPQDIYPTLTDAPAEVVEHCFLVASKCATLLFEGLKAHGTNMLVKDGANAGAEYDRFCIEAIARTEGDGLDYLWEPKQADPNSIKEMGSKIKSAIVVGETKTSEPIEKKAAEPIEQTEKHNYLLDELERMP